MTARAETTFAGPAVSRQADVVGIARAFQDDTELCEALLSCLDERLADLLEDATTNRGSGASEDGVSRGLLGIVITDDEVRHLVGTAQNRPRPKGDDVAPPYAGLWQQIEDRVAAARQNDLHFPLDIVRDRFELSAFEIDCVIVCLALELDRKYEKLYAYLNDDVTRKYASVDLLLRLVCPSDEAPVHYRRYLSPQARLLRCRLLSWVDESDGGPNVPHLSRCLRVDEGVAQFLISAASLDPALERVWDYPTQAAEAVVLWQEDETAERVGKLLQDYLDDDREEENLPLVCALVGPRGSGRRFAAQAACQARDMGVIAIGCRRLLAAPDSEAMLRCAFRDSALHDAPVVLSEADLLCGNEEHIAKFHWMLSRLIQEQGWLLFLIMERAGDLARRFSRQHFVELHIGASSQVQRQAHWQRLFALGLPVEEEEAVELTTTLAAKFRLTPAQIGEAFHVALIRGAQDETTDWSRLFHEQASALTAPRLGRLA